MGSNNAGSTSRRSESPRTSSPDSNTRSPSTHVSTVKGSSTPFTSRKIRIPMDGFGWRLHRVATHTRVRPDVHDGSTERRHVVPSTETSAVSRRSRRRARPCLTARNPRSFRRLSITSGSRCNVRMRLALTSASTGQTCSPSRRYAARACACRTRRSNSHSSVTATITIRKRNRLPRSSRVGVGSPADTRFSSARDTCGRHQTVRAPIASTAASIEIPRARKDSSGVPLAGGSALTLKASGFAAKRVLHADDANRQMRPS